MTRKTAFSLPGISEDARTTVSPSPMWTKWWLRCAIRLSALSGSPWLPVETSTCRSGGSSASSLASTSTPGGTRR